jgi:hypothetical protein
MSNSQDQDKPTVALYVGYTQALFELAPSGLRAMADSWESLTTDKTTDAIAETVKKLETEKQEAESGIQTRLEEAGFSNLDVVQSLMLERAGVVRDFEDKIAIANMIPSSEAFEAVMSVNGIPIRKPTGNTTQGLETDKVYRISRYGHERYWLVTEDKVSCYAYNGENSDHVVSMDAENYPDLFPFARGSLTKLGMCHDMAYHKEGTGKTTVERLKAGESSLPAWHKGIGLDSTTPQKRG